MSTAGPLAACAEKIIDRLGKSAITPRDHAVLARLSESLARNPDDPSLESDLRTLSHEGYLRGALVEVARSIRGDNPAPLVALRLANELLDALAPDLGVELAKAVLTLPTVLPVSRDPRHPYIRAHLMLGQEYLDRNEPVAALRHFEAVIALDLEHPLATRGVSACHALDPALTGRGSASLTWHDAIEGLDDFGLVGGMASGRYSIGRPLGRGRHAIVFEALDLRLNRPVAIKKLLEIDGPGSAQQRQLERRFFGEAKALAKVRSRHVISLFGAQPEHGFIALEVCRGGSLRQAMRRGKVTRADMDAVGEMMAAALRAVHAVGEIHRDIKPANILLRSLSPRPQAVLADFGLVRRVESTGPAMAGTLRYLAPEVRAGQNASAASDWYSLGLVLLELARSPLQLPESLDRLEGLGDPVPHLPEDLSTLWKDRLTRLLATEPGERTW
jgi:hypothetical protein